MKELQNQKFKGKWELRSVRTNLGLRISVLYQTLLIFWRPHLDEGEINENLRTCKMTNLTETPLHINLESQVIPPTFLTSGYQKEICLGPESRWEKRVPKKLQSQANTCSDVQQSPYILGGPNNLSDWIFNCLAKADTNSLWRKPLILGLNESLYIIFLKAVATI